ncbi:MAG: flagellar hook-associated protein FlgK [Burkholderiales bacterium]
MGNSTLNIGVTGLNVAQLGLLTTGHNIANANTPGFNRQQVVQVSSVPQFTGAGFLGQGVQSDNVRRIFSEFLNTQLLQVQAQHSQLNTYYDQIHQIDSLLADPSSGLSPSLAGFFNGVQDVAANPASIPSRQTLLSSAQILVARFHELNQRFEDLRGGINTQLIGSVTEINSLAQQIADLNTRITLAQSGSGNAVPNDLLDQRDALIAELNAQVRVSVIKPGDGSHSVFIGNGQPLVVGASVFSLSAAPAADDPSRLDVGYISAGATTFVNSSALQGGTLGGLLAFRGEILDSAQNAIGRIAVGLAQNFNDQHRLGQDLNGNLGTNFFSVTSPQVTEKTTNTGSAVIAAGISDVSQLTTSDYRLNFDGTNFSLIRLSDSNTSVFAALPQTIDGFTLTLASGTAAAGDSFLIQPTRTAARDVGVAITLSQKIAAAAPIRTSSTLANTGSGAIGAGSVNTPPPPNVNLQQPVTITFTSPTTFDVTGVGTGNPVGVAYTTGASISFNGWSVKIDGLPAAGDVFSIGPNSGGNSDNRNALLLGALQTRNSLDGASTSYQGAFSQLVSLIGNKSRETEVGAVAQEKLFAQVRQSQQSVSGVNLDEEAANLIRYQQAYQASGKVIQIAAGLFDTLLELN